MVNVMIFGSCRVRAGCMHKYIKEHKPPIDIKIHRVHTHGTKEVMQIIKLMRGNLNLEEIPFYKLIDNQPNLREYYTNLKFDADIYIIEVSSLKEVMYKKFFYQDYAISTYIREGNKDNIDFTKFDFRKQTKDSLLFDIKFIIRFLKKPIIFVPHINVSMIDINNVKLNYIEERKLIEDTLNEISKEYNHIHILSPGQLCMKLNTIPYAKNKDDTYDYSHYSEEGIDVMSKELYNTLLKMLNIIPNE